jgi:ABC-type sugar transport system ATPase subunit
MTTLQDPPPPAAADAAWHELQTQLAVENLSVASSQLLDLIRTLRLSLLLMDEETILAEEEYQVLSEQQVAQEAKLEAQKLEEEWRKRRNEL